MWRLAWEILIMMEEDEYVILKYMGPLWIYILYTLVKQLRLPYLRKKLLQLPQVEEEWVASIWGWHEHQRLVSKSADLKDQAFVESIGQALLQIKLEGQICSN